MLIPLTEMKLFERSVCLGGKEIISLLEIVHLSTPYVDLSYKLLRTGTETKAVGMNGVTHLEVIRKKCGQFDKTAKLKLQVSRTEMGTSIRGRQQGKGK